jgi:hypothetical protein
MPLIDDVIKTLERDHANWKAQTQFYGTVSVVIRMSLIISTAIVAAEKTLKAYLPNAEGLFFPTLSILVAIGTALDAWLKPREKWRGFMSDRDAANDLLIKVRNADPKDDAAKLDTYREQLKILEQRHVEKHVY